MLCHRYRILKTLYVLPFNWFNSLNSDGTYTWWNTKDKVQQLVDYCQQDVRTELSVAEALLEFPDSERRLYQLDQRINDRGVKLDVE